MTHQRVDERAFVAAIDPEAEARAMNAARRRAEDLPASARQGRPTGNLWLRPTVGQAADQAGGGYV